MRNYCLFYLVRLHSAWVHWQSAPLARQARMMSHHKRQKNYGFHPITSTYNIARANYSTCTYFFPKQTLISVQQLPSCLPLFFVFFSEVLNSGIKSCCGGVVFQDAVCEEYFSRAYSSYFMLLIVARMRLPFKMFSNFVHFWPNFQIFSPFCHFLPFFRKITYMPLLSRIGPF